MLAERELTAARPELERSADRATPDGARRVERDRRAERGKESRAQRRLVSGGGGVAIGGTRSLESELLPPRAAGEAPEADDAADGGDSDAPPDLEERPPVTQSDLVELLVERRLMSDPTLAEDNAFIDELHAMARRTAAELSPSEREQFVRFGIAPQSTHRTVRSFMVRPIVVP